ncbi:O-antigen ligase family protein [Aequorivita marisscotiae]|uniref:O-antigen ligase family protein n=1 Tax=Aequorivita marisscotiae TaxID=3040348 RepID=A0ABY8KVJ5_9FLAO|nr:O-antigen ligase family protein [Aequorivita sp. Ant34-E75]WGF93435.1 O-antigen ligase family protein [Aequorivita sp. Ant34-E75]
MIKGIKSYWSNKSIWQILFETSTYLFVATLPLWDKLNTLVLWLFVASSIFLLKPRERLENIKQNKTAFMGLFALYLLFIIGWLLSTETKDALRDMERTLTLVIIPLILLSHKREDFNLKKMYVAFGVGLFTAMVICWAVIIESILTNATPWVQAGYFFKWVYNGWNAVAPLEGHPSYFAVMLVIFIVGLIRMPAFKNVRKNKFKFILLLAPFFLFLIETSSRIGVICLVVIAVVTIFKKLEIKRIFYVIGLLIALAILSLKFDYLGSKMSQIVDSKGNITLDRYDRWGAILTDFKVRESWIFGIGTGDSQELYNIAYSKNGFMVALKNEYNAHSQYLEFLISNGMLGLLVYLGVLFIFFKKTRLKGEALSLFIIIVLFSGSETIFGISKGVFIFAFFYALFILLYSKRAVNV